MLHNLANKFRSIAPIFLLILGIVIPTNAQISAQERLAVFDQVWSAINERYYDKSFNGIDWEKSRRIYRKKAVKSSSGNKFFAILDEMVSQIRDSHTRVYSPDQVEARRSGGSTSAGFRIEILDELPVVIEVDPRSDAALNGLQNGMIVRSIDGVPFKKAFKAAEKRAGVSSSARSATLRALSLLISGIAGSSSVLEVQNVDGSPKTIRFERSRFKKTPPVESRLLKSGILYVKLRSFEPDVLESFENLIGKADSARGMILDLRSNSGGDGETGLAIAGKFFRDKKLVAEIITRNGKPPVPGIPMKLEIGAGEGAFVGPVAVLIDQRTASTAELVANAFQEHERARVFGEVSCGCVVAVIQPLELSNGGELTISEFGFLTFAGKKLEGQGVIPEVMVPQSIKDIIEGRDRVLEAAEIYLSSRD